MATVWVSRTSPLNFVARGLQDHKIWFQKPHFKAALFKCPTLGQLSPEQIEPAHWAGQANTGIQVKYLRESSPSLFQRIYSDVLACYETSAIGHDTTDPYSDLERAYRNALAKLPDSPSSDEYEYLVQQERNHIEATIEVERLNRSWRYHLLTYELDLLVAQ